MSVARRIGNVVVIFVGRARPLSATRIKDLILRGEATNVDGSAYVRVRGVGVYGIISRTVYRVCRQIISVRAPSVIRAGAPVPKSYS
jgi:hypothetical protein